MKESYVCLPLKFFRNPVFIRLSATWPRMVEWWYYLLTLAKEARAHGLLIVEGEPVTAELLSLLHRNEVPQEFLDDLVAHRWLDLEDGIYSVVDCERWYEPFENEARRRQVARERASDRKPIARVRGHARMSEDTVDLSADVQGQSRTEATCPRTSSDNLGQEQPVQGRPRLSTPDQTRPIPDQTYTQDPPQTPPPGVKGDGNGVGVVVALRSGVMNAAKTAYEQLCSGRKLDDKAILKLKGLENCRGPGVDDQVLCDCLLYETEKLLWSMQTGVETDIKSPWGLVVHRAIALVPQRVEWGRAVERGRRYGEPVIPFKFRPPEAS